MTTIVKDFLLQEDVGDRVLIDAVGGRLLIDEHTILDVEDLPVPRGLMFIEQVKFTEPYSLQLIGGDDQRLETFLAQKGILSEDDLRDSLDGEYHPQDRPITTPYPPQVRPPGGGGGPGGAGVLYPCGQIPVGGIIMWSGTIADIPECWALCDGTPPTPDLRMRFITGASVDAPTLNAYAVGETGGADEVDISHTHGAGTYEAAAHTHAFGTIATGNESAHTHGPGTLETDTQANHTHGPGSYDTDSDTHSHGPGTLNTGLPVPRYFNQVAAGSLVFPAVDPHDHDVDSGTTANDTHDHAVNAGVSGTGGSHAHDVDGGATATGSAHNHSISGSTASDGPHAVAGTSATGGDTTHDNRPQFYALAFIMRTS